MKSQFIPLNRKFFQFFNGIIFNFISIGPKVVGGKNITQDAFYWGNFLIQGDHKSVSLL